MTVGDSQIKEKLKYIEDGSNPFKETVPSHGHFEDIPGTCLKAWVCADCLERIRSDGRGFEPHTMVDDIQ